MRYDLPLTMLSIAMEGCLLMNQIPMKYLHPHFTACLTLILSICGFQLTSIALEKDTYSMLETPKDVNSVPSDAEATASGLASRVLTAGVASCHPSYSRSAASPHLPAACVKRACRLPKVSQACGI